ncbi:MAG: transcriptional regulator GlxA family with amidase domain [Halioglobus sp.]|jgi:transcriptional regulator GlxA family with amidase domain
MCSNQRVTVRRFPIHALASLVHTESDGALTLELLCSAAAMSRASFNARFTQLVGETPKGYLSNTRPLRAKTKLQHTQESIPSTAMAKHCGYAAFTMGSFQV